MKPQREHATNNAQTYMVTSSTWERRSLFQTEVWAKLLVDTLYHCRGTAYLLHEFVIMPDHIHVLMTPLTSLEKAVQFIKGGFSFRAKKELGSHMEVWQKGFQDHRIRDAGDYAQHSRYIHENPVRKHVCKCASEYTFSSAHPGFELDAVPQGLKPHSIEASDGAAKAASLQSKTESSNAESSKTELSKAEPSKTESCSAESSETELSNAESSRTERIKTEPSKTEASKTEASKGELAKAEPINAEPAKVELSKVESMPN